MPDSGAPPTLASVQSVGSNCSDTVSKSLELLWLRIVSTMPGMTSTSGMRSGTARSTCECAERTVSRHSSADGALRRSPGAAGAVSVVDMLMNQPHCSLSNTTLSDSPFSLPSLSEPYDTGLGIAAATAPVERLRSKVLSARWVSVFSLRGLCAVGAVRLMSDTSQRCRGRSEYSQIFASGSA